MLRHSIWKLSTLTDMFALHLCVPQFTETPEAPTLELPPTRVGAFCRPDRIGPMPTFTLDGVTYDYLAPAGPVRLHLIRSWEYGSWPRIEAQVPLVDGGTVAVYGEASRWSVEQVHVRWLTTRTTSTLPGSRRLASGR
jgi:hypothetical protein